MGKSGTLANSDVHRTVLWRFRTGRAAPGREIASRLQRVTGGRVAILDWDKHARGPLRKGEVRRTIDNDEAA